MYSRPKFSLKKDQVIQTLEVISLLIVLITTGITLIYYSQLPEIIPIHFNAHGVVDGYGSKYMIWILVIMIIVSFFGMRQFSKYPHLFNYPVKITEDNAKFQYKLAQRLMAIINVCVSLLMSYLIVITLLNSMNIITDSGNYFLPVTIGIIFTPIIIYFIVAIKYNPNAANSK